MCKKTTRRLLAVLLAVLAVLSMVSCSSEEPEAIVEAAEVVVEAEPVIEAEEPAKEEIVEPAPPVEPEEPIQPEEIVEPEPAAPAPEIHDYVLNTNTKKFHKLTCSSVGKIKEKNKADFTGTRDEVMGRGFDPCGNCKP